MDLPKGVQRVRKRLRDGSEAIYYYWRASRHPLPPPDDPGFSRALEAARAAIVDAPKSGTFRALVLDYKRSPAFRGLEPKTQSAYDRCLERLRKLEPQPVTDIKRGHVLTLRDALALKSGPQAANQLVQVLSVLMQFAIDREWRETNPCAKISRLEGGEHKRWPDTAIAYALKTLPEIYRRAVVLALYTGQREGDCVSMRWDQYDGTAIEVMQQKTGARLWIPVHRELKRQLDTWKKAATAETILVNSYGRSWMARSFATRFCRVAGEHKALSGLVFHGLRKAAAARLAEAGCSTLEIAAITGHATLQMVELYTREADQRRRARAAINRLELVSNSSCKPGENTPQPIGRKDE